MKRVAPTWSVKEAACGEAALELIEKQESYDLIFCDQYMSTTEKALLGTETIRVLRSKGIKTIICGLSANDLGDDFMAAGADSFILKPIPCDANRIKTYAVSNHLHIQRLSGVFICGPEY